MGPGGISASNGLEPRALAVGKAGEIKLFKTWATFSILPKIKEKFLRSKTIQHFSLVLLLLELYFSLEIAG